MKLKLVYSDSNFLVNFKHMKTVKDHKDSIGRYLHVFPEFIDMKYNDMTLENDKSLGEYNFKEMDDIMMFVNIEERNINVIENSLNTSGYYRNSFEMEQGCPWSKVVSYLYDLTHLVQQNEHLDDSKIVYFYRVKEAGALYIVSFIIEGKEIDAVVKRSESIADIKAKIAVNCGMNVHEIKLLMNNEELNCRDNVESLNLEENASLILKVYLKCGRDTQPPLSLMILNLQGAANEPIFNRINVDRTSSIQGLRSIISCELRMNLCGLDVYLLGDVFMGGTLENFKVEENNCLVLKSRRNKRGLEEQFFLVVEDYREKINGGHPSRFLVDDYQTVAGLKGVLRSLCDVSVSRMKLILDGEEMTDECVIKEHDIASGTVVQLVVSDLEEAVEVGGCGEGESGDMEVSVRRVLGSGLADEVRLLSVSGRQTVDLLRTTVLEWFELPTNQFVLSLRGEILKSGNLLGTYGIGKGDQVFVSDSILIRYFVAQDSNSAKVNRYAFLATDTVLDLKLRIKVSQGIEIKFINLSFNGEALQDHMGLRELGIENESYLMMVATLAGGGLA